MFMKLTTLLTVLHVRPCRPAGQEGEGGCRESWRQGRHVSVCPFFRRACFSAQWARGYRKQSANNTCRIKETLPREVTEKMHAPEQDTSIPFVTSDTMKQYDAFVSSHFHLAFEE